MRCALILLALATPAFAATPLVLRGPGTSPTAAIPVPAGVVQVFTHEGGDAEVTIDDATITLDYPRSQVKIDRATLKVLSRTTVADGLQRDAYGIRKRLKPAPHLVGPGVVDPHSMRDAADDAATVAEATVGNVVWRARQPRNGVTTDYPASRRASWTTLLTGINSRSALERTTDGKTVRYTTSDGLPGNIVTHLAVAGGTVYAACVDIHDPAAKAWTLGGLASFDAAANRWKRVEIDGQPVRFVTGLQSAGDDLYVLYRTGDGIDGDEITFGMGLFPGDYRPLVKDVRISRLDTNGKWTTFSRAAAPELRDRYSRDPATTAPAPAPTERLYSLAVDGPRLLVHSTIFDHGSGNWDVTRRGRLSVLDTSATPPTFRLFDTEKELSGDTVSSLHAAKGEIVATTNTGVLRWKHPAWQPIDTGAPLKNRAIYAVAAVGDEIWVGYNKTGFGVFGEQGISRYSEKTGAWTWMSPEELGTACPVSGIVAMDSDVYVHFKAHHMMTAAMEWDFYAREAAMKRPAGIGRYSAGKWTFPLQIDGLPEAIERHYKDAKGNPQTYMQPTAIHAVEPIAGKLYIASTEGLFQGPAPFRKIADDMAFRIEPSRDGKEVLAAMCKRDQYETGWLLRFDPATGKTTRATLDKETNPFFDMSRTSLEGDKRASVATDSGPDVPLPAAEPWTLGPIPAHSLRHVVTSSAMWLYHDGEVLRIDRKKLDALLAGKRP